MAITRCTSPHAHGTTCTDVETTYEGYVLGTFERNRYEDSDFVAVVWDTEQQAIVPIVYATTRFWTYHDGAVVDAPGEVVVQARQWLRDKLMPIMLGRVQRNVSEGMTVRSLTTRGKNKGIVGTVKRVVPNDYRRGEWRVLVETAEGGKHWMDAARVEVTDEAALKEARENAVDSAMHGGLARTYHAYLG